MSALFFTEKEINEALEDQVKITEVGDVKIEPEVEL